MSGRTRSRPPVRANVASARPESSCALASLAASDARERDRRRAGAARSPLPVHRVAHDLRGLRARRRRRDRTTARLVSWPPTGPRSREACPNASARDVAAGAGGFADDTAPGDALVAVPSSAGWAVGPTVAAARAASGKTQGRRSTVALGWPLEVPDGEWALTLRTTWVEPAYLETDASWCRPGGTPADPVANGGAFGGKTTSPLADIARSLADERDCPVRATLVAGGHCAVGAETSTRRCGRARRRFRRRPRGADGGHRRDDRLCRAVVRSRAGRRRRSADLGGGARRGVGGGGHPPRRSAR